MTLEKQIERDIPGAAQLIAREKDAGTFRNLSDFYDRHFGEQRDRLELAEKLAELEKVKAQIAARRKTIEEQEAATADLRKAIEEKKREVAGYKEEIRKLNGEMDRLEAPKRQDQIRIVSLSRLAAARGLLSLPMGIDGLPLEEQCAEIDKRVVAALASRDRQLNGGVR